MQSCAFTTTEKSACRMGLTMGAVVTAGALLAVHLASSTGTDATLCTTASAISTTPAMTTQPILRSSVHTPAILNAVVDAVTSDIDDAAQLETVPSTTFQSTSLSQLSLMTGMALLGFAVLMVRRLFQTPSQQPLLAPVDVTLDMGTPSMAMASMSSVKPKGRRSFRLGAKRAGPHTYESYYDINGIRFETDEYCNTTTRILEKVGVNLHLMPNHPLNILKQRVEAAFPGFKVYDSLTPVVTTFQNFDTLLVPEDHPSRSPTDTYYLNKTTLMRPHTSAHQHDLLKEGNKQFLCVGDVYRRDEIDKTHFWCFHQCEGVKVMDTTDPKEVEADLKASLENLVRSLFGELGEEDIRWVDAYFPFTDPSFELEIRWQGKWLEVLGCGIMQQEILRQAGADENGTKKAWAFGIGLERIAMVLFKIPDIRIFWSTNKRFLNQFADGQIREFQPLVSTKDYPANLKDVSMWVPEGFADNDFFDLIQNFDFADLVEEVELFDEFTHPKTGRKSKAFRVVFRSPERTLTTEEVNVHMQDIRNAAVDVLGVELR